MAAGCFPLTDGLHQATGNLSEVVAELFNCHRARLYRMSFRILGNRDDAEDALQESFLKAFQAIGSFRGEASVFSWLYRIVQNESLAKLQKRQRAQFVSIEDPIATQITHTEKDPNQGPDARLDTHQLAALLDRCIQGLPEKYRGAFVLKYVEDLSEKGVCDTLGLPLSTVKNRIHRGRWKIRNVLNRGGRGGESPVDSL